LSASNVEVISLRRFADWHNVVKRRTWTEPFALFIAADVANIPNKQLREFARHFVDHGMFWFSSWGPGCDRFEDAVDGADIDMHDNQHVVITTSHRGEGLDEATNLFWDALADDGKPWGPLRVAISVGHDGWYEELLRQARNHRAYATPEEAALAEWDAYPESNARVLRVDHEGETFATVITDTDPSHPMHNYCRRTPRGWVFTGDSN
jgi:hypothetical protein